MANYKPEHYPSVSPYLIAGDGAGLIDFLLAVFDASLVRRFDHEDGSLMHAEIRIDDGIVMIGGGADPQMAMRQHIHVYVPDAAATHARALSHGAANVQDPMRKRPDDDLRGGFADPAGHTWWVATQ